MDYRAGKVGVLPCLLLTASLLEHTRWWIAVSLTNRFEYAIIQNLLSKALMLMKASVSLLLILVLALACSRGADMVGNPQDVLGVTLGGSTGELETAYRQSGLSLNKTDVDSYLSSDAVDPPAGLEVDSVRYRVSSDIVRTLEATFAGDVTGELQAFIDKRYRIDPAQRLQLEQKQRFIGTIGENDHYWQLPDMGIMLFTRKGTTLLIYNMK